jgi:hypothetical protein
VESVAWAAEKKRRVEYVLRIWLACIPILSMSKILNCRVILSVFFYLPGLDVKIHAAYNAFCYAFAGLLADEALSNFFE